MAEYNVAAGVQYEAPDPRLAGKQTYRGIRNLRYREYGGGGGGGGGLGGGFPGLMDLAQRYARSQQDAWEAARQANLQRYQDILGGYRDVEAGLAGYGQQAATDISAREVGEKSKAYQGLVGAGMSGTTVTPGVLALPAREAAAERRRLGEQVQLMLAGQKGKRLDFMERKTDAYPDAGQFVGLMGGLGGALAGGGLASGYGGPGMTAYGWRVGSGAGGPQARMGMF